MQAHSPAPWEAYTNDFLKYATVCIGDVSMEIRTPNHQADARLIAAAPDLLEACQCALSSLPSEWVSAQILRAAIARAT